MRFKSFFRQWNYVTTAVLLAASVFVFSILPFSSANAAGLPVFFGGRSLAYVPVIVNPFAPLVPLCPAHITIQNLATNQPPVIGIYFTGLAAFQYLFGFLLTGSNPFFVVPGLPVGAWFLGNYDPVPYPTCPTPYPVVPVSGLSGVYYFGTSLRP
jgi:hypothetical protein